MRFQTKASVLLRPERGIRTPLGVFNVVDNHLETSPESKYIFFKNKISPLYPQNFEDNFPSAICLHR